MIACLHIGTIKTGSTTIQDFLYANRDLLRSRGYLYPLSVMQKNLAGQHDHNPLAYRRLRGLERRLRFEIRRNRACTHLLLSSETCASERTTPESIAEMKAFLEHLGITHTRILIYIRDPGALFASQCSQDIRNGAAENTALLSPQDNVTVRHAVAYRDIIEGWGAVFGADNITVRLFERDALHRSDLLRDFMQSAGCPWDERFLIPPRGNESLNLLEMELLRRINLRLPGHTLDAGTPKYQIYECLHRHLSLLDDPQLCFTPPHAICQAYHEAGEDDSEWVRHTFFASRAQLYADDNPSRRRNNYELREMRPEYWDALAALLVELGTRGEHPTRRLARRIWHRYRTRAAHWLRIILNG